MLLLIVNHCTLHCTELTLFCILAAVHHSTGFMCFFAVLYVISFHFQTSNIMFICGRDHVDVVLLCDEVQSGCAAWPGQWSLRPVKGEIMCGITITSQKLRANEYMCRMIFTALHVMQTRYSEENSVCLSVCPSFTRVICDKMEESSVQIFIPYERTFISLLWEEEWLVGGDPF